MDIYTFAPSILLVKSDSQIFMLAIVGYCWLHQILICEELPPHSSRGGKRPLSPRVRRFSSPG